MHVGSARESQGEVAAPNAVESRDVVRKTQEWRSVVDLARKNRLVFG